MNAPRTNRHTGGYTLVELIVAVGLFAIVMTLASGAYLTMINTNRQAQATATGINNLSFALEVLTRDIRTGYDFCGADVDACTTSTFSFRNSGGDIVTYSTSAYESICGGANACITRTKNRGTQVPLTDPSVSVTGLTFVTQGTATTDDEQPRVTIIVKASVAAGPGKTQSFTIETGGAMRGTDL